MISLSLSLSVSRAHTSPITLSSQLVSNNAFIHSNAPSVGYQTDQFSSARPRMQRNISPIAYYSKADPVFFPRFELFTNVQIFILFEPGNVLSRIIRRARSLLSRANLMRYLFVIFPFAFSRVKTPLYSNTLNSNNIPSTIILLICNIFSIF